MKIKEILAYYRDHTETPEPTPPPEEVEDVFATLQGILESIERGWFAIGQIYPLSDDLYRVTFDDQNCDVFYTKDFKTTEVEELFSKYAP